MKEYYYFLWPILCFGFFFLIVLFTKNKLAGKSIKVLGILLIIVITWMFIGHAINKSYSFNGTVENVAYDFKHIPTIIINGKQFSLSGSCWDFSHPIIEKGDKMIKKKGELDIRIIKQKNKDTLNFYKP